MTSFSESVLQATRFGIVGLVSNLTLYIIYFVLVEIGFDSKVVVTLLYVVGLSVTFAFNKRWSFSHRGGVTRSVKRYLALYGALYITNILVLWVFVDVFSLPHAVVQASVVTAFIPIVFLAQRYWVFPMERVFSMNHERTQEG